MRMKVGIVGGEDTSVVAKLWVDYFKEIICHLAL